MYTFIISITALVLGYFLYGRFVEKIFKPDPDKEVPAVQFRDGVDFIPLPTWKVFMIQLLNIAGTGPIFGAIMGAKFGPAAYLWIVLGCIFGGATHDYLAAMHSMRGGGISLPQIIGHSLNRTTEKAMSVFTIFLLILVGAVFVYCPAIILGDLTAPGSYRAILIWCVAIFLYYLAASLLPIDKIIGKIYPLFAFALIFMAAGLLVCLIGKWPVLPEFWNSVGSNTGFTPLTGKSIVPYLFITIACGAISGFHATQSPMMARCLKNEKLGRPIFFGAMISEGIIALIWATVASWFFYDGGAQEIGIPISEQAPNIVSAISRKWLGIAGGILALLGVVAAPITSGDTALRSARLTVADILKLKQDKIWKRLIIAIPIFITSGLFLWFNIANEDGFNVIWRHFGWANQTLACFTLWALSAHMARRRQDPAYLITLIPACFMTAICATYLFVDKICLNLPSEWSGEVATGIFAICAIIFFIWKAIRHPQEHLHEPRKQAEKDYI